MSVKLIRDQGRNTTSLSVSKLSIEELTISSFCRDAASLLGIVQGLAPTTVVY